MTRKTSATVQRLWERVRPRLLEDKKFFDYGGGTRTARIRRAFPYEVAHMAAALGEHVPRVPRGQLRYVIVVQVWPGMWARRHFCAGRSFNPQNNTDESCLAKFHAIRGRIIRNDVQGRFYRSTHDDRGEGVIAPPAPVSGE